MSNYSTLNMKNFSDESTVGFDELKLTRVTNACVLIELGEFAVLTDPWFRKPWGFNEEPGLRVQELPTLNAIIGSHFANDHWGIDAFLDYPHHFKTPVYTATKAMAKRANKIGFMSVECLSWGESREITSGLTLEVVEAQAFFGLPSNNYVLANEQTRIFFGGETKSLKPLQTYRTSNPAVDIVIAPANGMHILGYQLVTTAYQALEAARILNAHTLIPIHDSMHNMGFGGPTSSANDLQGHSDNNLQILFLDAGQQTTVTSKNTAGKTN